MFLFFLFFLNVFTHSLFTDCTEYITTQRTFLCIPNFPEAMIGEAKLTIAVSILPQIFVSAALIIPNVIQKESNFYMPGIIHQSLIVITTLYSLYQDLHMQQNISFKTKYFGQSPNSILMHKRNSNFMHTFTIMHGIHFCFLLYNVSNSYFSKKGTPRMGSCKMPIAQNLITNVLSLFFTFTAQKRLDGKIPLANHLD
ncbi:MAG TPA: hypothetical protein VL201_04075 [Patescibacteria group bacterium]|jgi:hypothetical protein|nr:hypothetical protein [Patescibacteria group bacterium]